MGHKHMTDEERAKILDMHRKGVSAYLIGIKVGRHVATVNKVIVDAKEVIACDCGKKSVVKFKGEWVCGDCLNPEPDEEYLAREYAFQTLRHGELGNQINNDYKLTGRMYSDAERYKKAKRKRDIRAANRSEQQKHR